MRISILIAAIVATGPFARAEKADDPICTDIHRVACTVGDITDPTGISRLAAPDSNPITPEVRQELKLNLATMLKDTANSKLKKSVLKLAQLPDCEKDDSSDGCIDALSSAIAAKIEARLVTGTTTVSLPVAEEGKIQDLQAVLDSAPVAQASAKLMESFKAKSGEAELATRAEKEIFAHVKEALTMQIQDLIGDEKSRVLFLDRIKAVEWGGSDCGAASLAAIMTPDVFLNPNDNKIYVCRGVGRLGTSEYGLAFLLTREIANFISPCGVTKGKNVPAFKYTQPSKAEIAENEFPFRGILSCLRSKGSVFAQRGMGLSRDTIALCDKSDQINESFVDWLAVEAMSDYIAKFLSKHSKQDKKSGIIGLMRSQCMPGAGLELADRTPVEERFNRLLLSNPDIRETLGCKVKPLDVAYCAPVPEPNEAPEEKRE